MNNLSHIKSLSALELDYDLPNEKIAKHPLEERNQSKLLVWKNNEIKDTKFTELASLLPNNSMLVFNNTKVIRARLNFTKSTGANIEIFCLDPQNPADYQMSFQQHKCCTWNCMVGNLKKWKTEKLQKEIFINNDKILFSAEKLQKKETSIEVKFSWNNENYNFATLIEATGILPIPPYLHRETEPQDIERYQTIYSKEKGSVAAPTAGLHFTEDILESLKAKDIEKQEITLHVGAGTFKPVKTEHIGNHEMHAEQVNIEKSTIKKLIEDKRKVIAVGTTSIRSLESLYWLGVKLYKNSNLENKELNIEQWIAYESAQEITKREALEVVVKYLNNKNLDVISFYTKIIIVPGYKFKIIEGMITNFHQPQSTLLLLISAFIGNEWKRVYKHAIDNNYRFLSYGDSNLYLK